MGTDELFYKKRVRLEREMTRQKNLRSAYEVVLIICEGTQTEPNYFRGLRTHLRLNRENILIHEGNRGTDPLSLVNVAEEEFIRARKRDPEKQGYDRVYIVFDRDSHTTYNDALQRIRGLNDKYKGKFKPIVSIPCFEIWLLLHFGYTTRPYGASGGHSPCDNLIRDLNGNIAGYTKGDNRIFDMTKDLINEAAKNAKMLKAYLESAQTDNPSTDVHYLVEYLIGIRK